MSPSFAALSISRREGFAIFDILAIFFLTPLFQILPIRLRYYPMLPPGHIAGAYLTTTLALLLIQPAVTSHQQWMLLLIGIFFGIAPDFDFFYGFIKYRRWTASEDVFDHRQFLSHAPLIWLFTGLLVSLIAANPFWKFFGLLIWIGSWTHFALDSVEQGVKWFWPFSQKTYALRSQKIINRYITKERRFFPFWIGMVKHYAQTSVVFYCEIAVIIIAVGYWFWGR